MEGVQVISHRPASATTLQFYNGQSVMERIAPQAASRILRGPLQRVYRKVFLVLVISLVTFFTADCVVSASASSQLALPPGFKPKDMTKIYFVSVPFIEHVTPMLAMAQELMARGYHVKFASYNKASSQIVDSGVDFISMGDYPVPDRYLYSQMTRASRDSNNFRGVVATFNEMYLPAAVQTFHETYRAFVAESNRPDLLVLDIATLGAAEAALKLGIPYMFNSPTLLFDMENRDSFVPAWGTGLQSVTSLWDRCISAIFPRVLSVALTPPFMNLNKMRWELKLPPYRSQHDVFKSVRVLTNSAFGLEFPQAVRPLVELVGPIAPPKKKMTPIAASLANWMKKVSQQSQRSLIYVHFGTTAWLEGWHIETLVQGLDDPESFAVIWTMPGYQLEVLSQNPAIQTPPELFEILPLMPPVISPWSIMREKSVAAVISDCGSNAAELALYYNKPLLCIPFLADQPDMAARVVASGAGLSLSRLDFGTQDVYTSIKQLTSNSSFATASANVGGLIRRAGGRTKAADLIEATHFIGIKHLQTIDEKLPWFKVAMIDVLTLVLALLSLILVVSRIGTLLLLATAYRLRHFVSQDTGEPVADPGELRKQVPSNMSNEEGQKGNDNQE